MPESEERGGEALELVLACACVVQPCPNSCATPMHSRPSLYAARPPSCALTVALPARSVPDSRWFVPRLARALCGWSSAPRRCCCSHCVKSLEWKAWEEGSPRCRSTEQAKILTRSLAGLVLLVLFNLFAQAGPFAGLAQTADARGHTRPALARLLPTPRVLITLSGYPAEQAGLV